MGKKILSTVHSTVTGLQDAGIVDATTMRHFDELCVEPPREMSKTEIKKVRLSQKVSQPVFAKNCAYITDLKGRCFTRIW